MCYNKHNEYVKKELIMEKSYNELCEAIAKIYSEMGYSDKPLYEYKDPDENILDYDGYSKYAKTFDLSKNDLLTIMKVINCQV